MGQRPACLVFRVQVEELDRNRVLLEPLRQASHHARFADSALSTYRENHALGRRTDRHSFGFQMITRAHVQPPAELNAKNTLYLLREWRRHFGTKFNEVFSDAGSREAGTEN